MSRTAALALTSHGNAPYLMASRLASALKMHILVLPLYYGHSQIAILQREIGQTDLQIYLSETLGAVLQPLLLESEPSGVFTRLTDKLIDDTNPDSIQSVQDKFDALMREGFSATALNGTHRRFFSIDDFSLTINTAQPIQSPIHPVVFLFTSRLSELYGLDLDGNPTAGSLRRYAERWRQVEDTCRWRFVPRVNALSHLQLPRDGVINTPAFARADHTPPPAVAKGTILFVASGTRTDVSKLIRLAQSIPEDKNLVTFDTIQDNLDFPSNRFGRVPASIFSADNLEVVICRGGWGTLWECLAHKKPVGVVRTTFKEDPEMGHTHRTIEALGFGVCLDQAAGQLLDNAQQNTLHQGLNTHADLEARIFNSYAVDGIQYIADVMQERIVPVD